MFHLALSLWTPASVIMLPDVATFWKGRRLATWRVNWNCATDLGIRRRKVSAAFRAVAGVTVVEVPRIVWNCATARRAARRLQPAGVVVFNFCVWSYPDVTAQVANRLTLDTLIHVLQKLMGHASSTTTRQDCPRRQALTTWLPCNGWRPSWAAVAGLTRKRHKQIGRGLQPRAKRRNLLPQQPLGP